MRVIDLDNGVTLQAANDDDLFKAVRDHYDQEGSGGGEMSDEDVRRLIEEKAYSASDS